jgi:hypothetical protein
MAKLQKFLDFTPSEKMYSFQEDLYRYTVSDMSDFHNIILKFNETEPHILKIITTKLKFNSIICNSFK